jgi:hypothetical protein
MRPCAILEAWVQRVFQGGVGPRLIANAEKAVTELIRLIKWRSARRNLKRRRRAWIEAAGETVNGQIAIWNS